MAYDRKRDLLFVGMHIHGVRAIPCLSVNWMTLPSQYVLKVNNRNTKTRCQICSKFYNKDTPTTSFWCFYR